MTYVNQYAKTSKQMYVKQTVAFLIQSRLQHTVQIQRFRTPKKCKDLIL